MEEKHYYNTVASTGFAEFKDRGSKFLAFVYPIDSTDDVKKRIEALKKEHPKANHHCFAYRLGLDGNSFRASDDGEPSGSAGKPILGQIDSKECTNTLIVVVRYFGGTLLGVPGLINAYKTAAAFALQVTPITQKQVLHYFNVQFDYTQMNEVMTLIKQMDGLVTEKEQSLFCRFKVGIPSQRVQQFVHEIKELHTVECSKV